MSKNLRVSSRSLLKTADTRLLLISLGKGEVKYSLSKNGGQLINSVRNSI